VLFLLFFAAAAPSPLYGVYQSRWRFSATTLTAVFAAYAVLLLATLLVFGCRTTWAAAGVAMMPESGPRRPGVLASLRRRVVVPRPVRGTFAPALPCLIAVWMISGFYPYLAFSVPVVIAGVATTHVGLHRTALVYCAVIAALAAAAAGSLIFRSQVQSPIGYPAAALRSRMATRTNHERITTMNIVLIHGAWAEGSCWSGVIERLQADGYHVTAPQFPLTALADDVARLRQVLDLQDGPAIVAGHSYGGQVMTALGADAPNVAGLVYIAAFGLDQGESLGGLLSQGPVTPALAHLFTDKQGFGWLSEDDFVNHFAADVDPVAARVMHAVQQPLAMSAFGDVMGVPAWKTLPSWYLVAADDQALPPEAERAFAGRMGATTVEIPSSHVAMVSHPGDVAELIKTAAESVAATS
jgi:pimeloyl-ACP methyl ester carboxylesterase